MVYDYHLSELILPVEAKVIKNLISVAMAVFGAICLLLFLYTPDSVLSNQEIEKSIEDICYECLEKDMFFYRGLFPNENYTTTCVPSHEHLMDGVYLMKKACVPQDCRDIGSIMVQKECLPPHPYSNIF